MFDELYWATIDTDLDDTFWEGGRLVGIVEVAFHVRFHAVFYPALDALETIV
jgi:hypothetical protein